MLRLPSTSSRRDKMKSLPPTLPELTETSPQHELHDEQQHQQEEKMLGQHDEVHDDDDEDLELRPMFELGAPLPTTMIRQMRRRQSLPGRSSCMLYEESIPVVVRRRGVTMTVRIFGAEEDEAESISSGQDHMTGEDWRLNVDSQNQADLFKQRSLSMKRSSLAGAANLSSHTVPSRSVDSLLREARMGATRRIPLTIRMPKPRSAARSPAEMSCPPGAIFAADSLSTIPQSRSLSPSSPITKSLSPTSPMLIKTLVGSESPTDGIGSFKKVGFISLF